MRAVRPTRRGDAGAEGGEGARSRRRTAGGLHRHPPLTPAGVLLRYRATVPVLVAVFVSLALAAALDGGSLLLTWDEPVQRWAEGSRSGALDRFMGAVSHLGGLTVVVLGLVVLLALVWGRCHSLALALLAATLARPVLEWTLKRLVGRDRPDFERLVSGDGPSFPSGHVMAAIALWGLLPPVVALVTRRRALWWWSVAGSALVVLLVGASRVYLGVHWLSDVAGAMVLGALYLLAIEWLLALHHERRPCQAFSHGGRGGDEGLASGPRPVTTG